MEKIIQYIDSMIWDIPLIVAIMLTGIYFTIASRFFQLRFLPRSCTEILHSFSRKGTKSNCAHSLQPDEVFFISLGTTAGVGNIIGVTMAVIVGGAGSIFWMWISAMIGMVIKIAEVTLATYYRNENTAGNYYSSPMDYIEKGIGMTMNFKTWIIPVLIFSAGVMLTFVTSLQNYEVSRMVHSAVNIHQIPVATMYAALIYLFLYKGGIKSYSRIACKLIPIVLLTYVGVGIIVILSNYDMLLPGLIAIFEEAFSIKATFGGFVGRGIVEVIAQGLSIALFTNEAGWGTAPMLYSRATTEHPIKLGLLSALEVFIISMVICSTTALVVIVAGQYVPGIAVNDLVINSFSTGIGSAAIVFVPLIMFIFGFTTSVGWYFYFEVIIMYFCRKLRKNAGTFLAFFKIIYPLPGMFMVFYAAYFQISGEMLWNIMAIATGVPAFINVFSILILSNKFFELIQDYKTRYLNHKGGDQEIIPLFYGQEKDIYGDLEDESPNKYPLT